MKKILIMDNTTNKRMIKLFDNYLNNIENEYNIDNKKILKLKNKIRKNVKTMGINKTRKLDKLKISF